MRYKKCREKLVCRECQRITREFYNKLAPVIYAGFMSLLLLSLVLTDTFAGKIVFAVSFWMMLSLLLIMIDGSFEKARK